MWSLKIRIAIFSMDQRIIISKFQYEELKLHKPFLFWKYLSKILVFLHFCPAVILRYQYCPVLFLQLPDRKVHKTAL